MRRVRVLGTAALAAGLALSGCTSDNGSTDSPSPSTSPTGSSADGGAAPEAPPEGAAATLTRGDTQTAFVLVLCESSDDGSLTASGDNIDSGQLLSIDAVGGAGTVEVADDASLDQVFEGSLNEFTIDAAGVFNGAGTYSADGQQGEFSITGDCKTQ